MRWILFVMKVLLLHNIFFPKSKYTQKSHLLFDLISIDLMLNMLIKLTKVDILYVVQKFLDHLTEVTKTIDLIVQIPHVLFLLPTPRNGNYLFVKIRNYYFFVVSTSNCLNLIPTRIIFKTLIVSWNKQG